MLNKIYVKGKNFFKENYKILGFFLILNIILIFPVPYYVYIGGGIADIDDKIIIEDSYEKNGSLNLAYVDQINGTVSSFLLSYIVPAWKLEKISNTKLDDKESKEDIEDRNQKLLEIANNNATKIAYKLAGKEITIKTKQYMILYIYDRDNCPLKIGDIILTYDNITINDYALFVDYINSKKLGERVSFRVQRANKRMDLVVKVRNVAGQKKLGIGVQEIEEYLMRPKITFKFAHNESGPSGGLMLSLAIYNKLIANDITKGLKIAGTGAINSEGLVESIDGIKYKLAGAIKGKADVFLVPVGDNYEEALRLKKAHDYKIKIIAVSSVEDAINKLKAL